MSASNGSKKETLKRLLKGELSWDEIKKEIIEYPKNPRQFQDYIEALKELVPVLQNDQILLRIHEHLYIVRDANGERVIKCDCGYNFGDYRENWKVKCDIYVRKTLEEFAEVYQPLEACPSPEWTEIREYYCPSCAIQLAVEVVPHGYPTFFEFLPDLDTFYSEWLGEPLPDGGGSSEDRTPKLLLSWLGTK